VAAAEHVHEVSVIPYQIADKTPGFLDHRRNQLRAKQWERSLLTRRRQRPVEAEPLRGELIERCPGARVRQHSPRRALHAGAAIELSASGAAQKLVVRRGVPQRIGEATGGRIGLPIYARRPFHPEQEARRLQHAFDYRLSALQEIAL